MDKSEHQRLHELGLAHSHEEHTKEDVHVHEEAHMQEHLHEHGEGHHHHVHSAEEKKAVLNRLSRAIGHLQSIKTMVEEDRDCSEVLIQLSAVKSAVNNTGKLVLKEHISHCIVEAIESGDEESLRQLNKAIDSFVK